LSVISCGPDGSIGCIVGTIVSPVHHISSIVIRRGVIGGKEIFDWWSIAISIHVEGRATCVVVVIIQASVILEEGCSVTKGKRVFRE
jgi:hypothetical protein